MAVIALTDAQLAFGHVALLDHAQFSLEAGEHVGLIGRNGSGKSSLLKIISGQVQLDDGIITRQQSLRLASVTQEPQFDPAMSVFDTVAAGLGPGWDALREYNALSASLGIEASPSQLARLHELQHVIDEVDAWSLSSRVKALLDKLDLSSAALMGDLSGGTQKRVALACALVAEPDVLLLDEPTNHLDFKAIAWLEGLLKAFRGSVLFITHDRHFLDAVASRIIELDRGRLLSYLGNFSAYQISKANQLAVDNVENAKFDKFLAQEEVWIRKGVEARRTRNEGRVLRLKELRRQHAARREQQGQVKFKVASGDLSGKIIAELGNVTKIFGNKTIVRNFSATLLRGDKVGLIGSNGAGKTTLLKLILGELAPDSGHVKQGTRLQVAYFDQMRAQLNESASLVDTISPGSDWIEINGKKKHVMSYLGDFLFSPARARSPISSLSGGERNRLLLARLFAKPANVLVLDEPTNDLDIDTLELLEELLQSYDGAVFLVSHDRTFLDNVVTQAIVAEGDGYWREHVFGFSNWDWTLATQEDVRTPNKAANAASTPLPKSEMRMKKLSYKEARQLEEFPAKISALESEQQIISARLSDPDLYAQCPQDAVRLQERFSKIEDELLEILELWETLEARSSK